MTTAEKEINKTNNAIKPKKEPVDWRAELYDDWDYHGIIYTIGKTLAWVIVVSAMAGWIYGLITEQV